MYYDIITVFLVHTNKVIFEIQCEKMDVIDLCDYEESSTPATIIHTGNYDYVSGIINSEFDKTKGAVKDDKINSSWTVEDKEQGYISLLSDDEDLPPPPKLPRTTSSGVSSLGGSQEPLGEPQETPEVCLEPPKEPLGPAEEKARRKAFLANLKTMKPGECMKYITLEVDPALLVRAEFLLVAGALGEAGVGLTPAAPAIPPGCLSWTRRPPPNRLLTELHGQLSMSTVSREPHLLLVMFISEALELLKKRGLLPHLADIKRSVPESQVTLLLYGAASHFKKQKNKKNSRWKKQMRGEAEQDIDLMEVTENDLDYYLTKLLFSESVSCVRAETSAELAQVVLQFTKAVAEAPFKKEKHSQDLQSDFYMRGDNRDCVKVDAQGNGLLRLWSQALAKFPQGGLDVGQALCRRYPSPRILAQALQGSPDRVLEELAAVEVRRAAGPQAAPRRLGPELAKKLRTYFTATDGDVRLA